MNFFSLLESMNGKLIVVDVQPSYKQYISFSMPRFVQFMSQYNRVLVLFNGPDMGMENQEEILDFYSQNGLEEDDFYKLQFFEKGYAFFRDLLDACWAREDLIKIIRYLISHNLYDIRQLKEDDLERLDISDLTQDILNDHGFYIPELKRILPAWNGSDLCGGGFQECLNEVMLLSEAMNLRMNLVKQFTYG